MNRFWLLLFVLPLVGCQSGPFGTLLVQKERTTFDTPSKRAEEALALAARATGEHSPEQQQLLNDLARRIQSENDPLVREALVEAVARFPMPLADQVLAAGLADSEPGVRQQCCRMMGERGLPASVPQLAGVASNDDNFDVRVAATRALGQIESPEAVRALAAALEDSNPAMQFAGVEAMRNATGQDLGGDVRAYLALARGETPVVATRPDSGNDAEGFLQRWSPF